MMDSKLENLEETKLLGETGYVSVEDSADLAEPLTTSFRNCSI